MDEPITVTDIVRSAGGAAVIARACEVSGDAITRAAVYKWSLTGIPDRHWGVLMGLTAVTPADLYQANCVARARPAREAAE